MSLEQLIEKCKENDTKAQSDLYKLFSSKLFALCLKYSRNHAEAEDNLQDAFVTIFKKISQYSGKGSLEGWLKRILLILLYNVIEHKAFLTLLMKIRIEDVQIDVETETVDIDFLLNSIQELPDRYRLVFNLYVLDGYSHKEISEMLEITTGTTKSNLARARKILKDKSRKLYGEFKFAIIMKNDKKHIDRLFQEGLKNFEATPSDAVWENIYERITLKTRKRKVIPLWIRLSGIAAGLLLLFTLGNKLFFQDDNTIPELNETIVDTNLKTIRNNEK